MTKQKFEEKLSNQQFMESGSFSALTTSLRKSAIIGCTKPLEDNFEVSSLNANSMRNDSACTAFMTEQAATTGTKEVGEALIALNDFTAFLFLSGRSAACTLTE